MRLLKYYWYIHLSWEVFIIKTILYAKAVNFFFLHGHNEKCHAHAVQTGKCYTNKIDTYKRTLRMGYWLILLEFF